MVFLPDKLFIIKICIGALNKPDVRTYILTVFPNLLDGDIFHSCTGVLCCKNGPTMQLVSINVQKASMCVIKKKIC